MLRAPLTGCIGRHFGPPPCAAAPQGHIDLPPTSTTRAKPRPTSHDRSATADRRSGKTCAAKRARSSGCTDKLGDLATTTLEFAHIARRTLKTKEEICRQHDRLNDVKDGLLAVKCVCSAVEVVVAVALLALAWGASILYICTVIPVKENWGGIACRRLDDSIDGTRPATWPRQIFWALAPIHRAFG